MAEKKLSKKALNKSFRNWFYSHLTCFSQEHMQTFGNSTWRAMLPLGRGAARHREGRPKPSRPTLPFSIPSRSSARSSSA